MFRAWVYFETRRVACGDPCLILDLQTCQSKTTPMRLYHLHVYSNCKHNWAWQDESVCRCLSIYVHKRCAYTYPLSRGRAYVVFIYASIYAHFVQYDKQSSQPLLHACHTASLCMIRTCFHSCVQYYRYADIHIQVYHANKETKIGA